jgi:Cof subfamily protein (haloacid dehalogenase superfamily)
MNNAGFQALPEGNQYEALALDLDGTLLNAAGELEPLVVSQVKNLSQRGVPVFLVSGRMQPAIDNIWRQLQLLTHIVSYNGARIALPGQLPIYDQFLPDDLAEQALAFCQQAGFHLNIYADDMLYVSGMNRSARWYSEHFGIELHPLPPDGLARIPPRTKLLTIVEEGELDDTYAALAKEFGQVARIVTSSRRFVEILPLNASKANALRVLADKYSIPLEKWIAVGDGMNDLDMIHAAGLGVAVENGDEKVKLEADLVVPPLPEGGLGVLMEKFFSSPQRREKCSSAT